MEIKEMLERLFFDTRLIDCEKTDCEENRRGKCLLKEVVINSKGECGMQPLSNKKN